MDRNLILSRILGPIRDFGTPSSLEWQFISKRKKEFGIDRRQARRFTLRYDPRTRQFSATCTRYISKRNKRQSVKVSVGMVAYLRTKLSDKAIARIMAASITEPSTSPAGNKIAKSGFQLYVQGQSNPIPIHSVNLPTLKGV